jgi:hypothetical protein
VRHLLLLGTLRALRLDHQFRNAAVYLIFTVPPACPRAGPGFFLGALDRSRSCRGLGQ